jgi:hypothetical protein
MKHRPVGVEFLHVFGRTDGQAGKKNNPITGLDRPWVFQEFEAPIFQDSQHMKVVRSVSPTHRPPLPPRKYSWYSFLLEAESTSGCGRKEYVNEKFQGHLRDETDNQFSQFCERA